MLPVALQAFNGHLYHVVATPVDSASALAFAQVSYYGMQGHLVTINSAAENTFVTGLTKVSWLGSNDLEVEGTFKYSAGPEAGSNVVFFAWGGGQPDNAGDNEDCMQLWEALPLPNNQNDRPCSVLMPYVIEYECPAGQTATSSGCQGNDSMFRF